MSARIFKNIRRKYHSLTLVLGHSVSTYSNFFSLETANPIEAKFHMEHLWDGGKKTCSDGPGHITNMTNMTIHD